MTKNAIARQNWQMTTDAPNDDAFVSLCESLSLEYLGQRLDSLDLGDALGAIIQIATKENLEDPMIADWIWAGEGFSITLSFEWDLFKWGE